jgi:hypothetical protein
MTNGIICKGSKRKRYLKNIPKLIQKGIFSYNLKLNFELK